MLRVRQRNEPHVSHHRKHAEYHLKATPVFHRKRKNKSAQIKNFITLLSEIGIASFQHFCFLCVGLGEAVNIASISFRSERALEDFVGQVYLGI